MLHVVLIEPEIPQNTGNIARTCAATGSELHLVKPLGFKLEDKYLKRAGLDYWPLVKVHVHEDFAQVLERYPGAPFFYASTKAPRSYAQVSFPQDAFLVFGKESRGLPENLLGRVYERCIRIPMVPEARSLTHEEEKEKPGRRTRCGGRDGRVRRGGSGDGDRRADADAQQPAQLVQAGSEHDICRPDG